MDAYAPPEAQDAAPRDQNATLSAVLGLVAMGLNMTGCCTSVFGIMGGFIAGLAAFFLAYTARQSPLEGESRAYANVGFWSGLVSMIWGGIVFLLVMAYVMVYVVMFMMMGGLAVL